MSSGIPLGEVVHFDVDTSDVTTGGEAAADSTPVFRVYEEDADAAILGPTNLTARSGLTGGYRGTFTMSVANGFEIGKWYIVRAFATVGGVTNKTIAMHFLCVAAGEYVDDYVYLSNNGVSGTTVGLNGTINNPVALGSEAVTIATAIGRKRIRFLPLSSTDTIFLDAADYSGFAFDLNGARVDTNGNDVDANTRFYSSFAGGTLVDDLFGGPGPLDLSGAYYDSIFLTNPRIVGQTYVNKCGLEGTLVVGAGGTWETTLANCYSINTSFPINFGSISGSTTKLRLLGWSGDLALSNMRAGQTLEVYGYVGKVTIAASCTGGTIKHSSHHELFEADGTTAWDKTNTTNRPTVDLVSDHEATDELAAELAKVPRRGTINKWTNQDTLAEATVEITAP